MAPTMPFARRDIIIKLYLWNPSYMKLLVNVSIIFSLRKTLLKVIDHSFFCWFLVVLEVFDISFQFSKSLPNNINNINLNKHPISQHTHSLSTLVQYPFYELYKIYID